MGRLRTLMNTPVILRLPSDYADSGWELSEDKARHYPCNPGRMVNPTLKGTAGVTYFITYVVEEQSGGFVRVEMGNTFGVQRTAPGTYTEQIVSSGTGEIKFYSSGSTLLSKITVHELSVPAVTFAFMEGGNLWTTYYSYHPELMVKFMDQFFIFVSGQCWLQNENEERNTFCGVKYKSAITFYVNINASQYKQFHSIRIEGNKVWYSPTKGDIRILPTERKPNGMLSRLKKQKFKNLNGDWFADFLRNMIDPRYNDELNALMFGEELQGKVLQITIENNDIDEVILEAVDVTASPVNFTY